MVLWKGVTYMWQTMPKGVMYLQWKNQQDMEIILVFQIELLPVTLKSVRLFKTVENPRPQKHGIY